MRPSRAAAPAILTRASLRAARFDLPVFVICLISILNDGTIMSIAYDAVVPSRQPTRWELPRTCAVAATIGAVGVASTFLLLYLARPVPDAAGGFAPSFFHFMKLPQLADAQVQALIYLQLSIGGQATIFVARTASYCFSETPGLPLLAAFVFAQVVSTLLTVFVTSGLSPMIGLGMDCTGGAGKNWTQQLVNIEKVNDCAKLFDDVFMFHQVSERPQRATASVTASCRGIVVSRSDAS